MGIENSAVITVIDILCIIYSLRGQSQKIEFKQRKHQITPVNILPEGLMHPISGTVLLLLSRIGAVVFGENYWIIGHSLLYIFWAVFFYTAISKSWITKGSKVQINEIEELIRVMMNKK